MFADFYDTLRARYGTGDNNSSISEWVCANTSLKKKPFNFSRFPFQRQICDDMHKDLTVEKCSQVGLALALDTEIPTAVGWTTMGDVKVGDELYDEAGQPCTVTYTSPVWLDRQCYRVTFDDGESIVADADHKWAVESVKPFNHEGIWGQYGAPPVGQGYEKSGVITTKVIAKSVKHNGRYVYRIKNTGPIYGSSEELSVEPYLLGLWLGDGSLSECRIASGANDADFYVQELARRGCQARVLPLRNRTDVYVRLYTGCQTKFGRGYRHELAERMKNLGLLRKSKFIPKQYLRASYRDRLSLLQGLMDTDGCIDSNGNACFSNTSAALILDVAELLNSLGRKSHFKRSPGGVKRLKGQTEDTFYLPVYRVSFTATSDFCPVLLPRKRARLKAVDSTKSSYRRIVGVEPVDSVPTRCIQVNSPNHLFLAGRGMIPTHNTEIQIRKFFAILTRGTALNGLFSLPTEDMYRRIYSGRMSPILKTDPIFNPPTLTSPVRRNDLVQIRDSFGYITGCTEGDATSISADILFHDEYDLSPQNIIGLFPSRLQGSDIGMTQSFSTPSFLNFGINKAFTLSDQHEYMVKCDSCGHQQIPDFTFSFIHIRDLPDDLKLLTDLSIAEIASLDLTDAAVVCEKCRRPLDLGRSDNREWVARHPGRSSRRGYKVRPFSTGRLSVPYILDRLSKARQNENIRGFHNTVLGNAYTDSTAQIQRGEIEAVMAPTGNIPSVGKSQQCYLGVDVGQTCHLVLTAAKPDGMGQDFVLFDTCHISALRERLAILRDHYNLVLGCADRFPYTPTVDALREDLNGLIMPVQYRGTAPLTKVRNEIDEITHYSVNRTMALDKVKSAITDKTMVIAGYGPHRETIITHFGDMVRNERPEQEPVWEKISGNDHFHHAAALALLAPRISEDVYHSTAAKVGSVIMVQSSDWMKNAMAPTNSLLPQSAKRRAGSLG